MPQRRILILGAMLALIAGLMPAHVDAQTFYNYKVGLAVGFGGTSDADRDPDFDNVGFQALFSMKTENRVSFAVRLGQLQLETDDTTQFFDFDATLTYLTLVGEYEYTETFYEGSLYFGVGGYDLTGEALIPDETSFGLTLGSTADFRIAQRWSINVELAGHLSDLDYAGFFITGHAGLIYRF